MCRRTEAESRRALAVGIIVVVGANVPDETASSERFPSGLRTAIKSS
jgi:hypothetical protein